MSTTKTINDDLAKENALPILFGPCCNCENPIEILIHGYADTHQILICRFHAIDLARILLADVYQIECERRGKGG